MKTVEIFLEFKDDYAEGVWQVVKDGKVEFENEDYTAALEKSNQMIVECANQGCKIVYVNTGVEI